MPTLQLIVEPRRGTERRRKLEVDATMLIGDCVARLVDELGYPAKDSYATPISYHLRVLPQGQPLPNAQRFSEVGIASETHVVLEAEAESYATQPIAAAPLDPTCSFLERWTAIFSHYCKRCGFLHANRAGNRGSCSSGATEQEHPL